MGFSYTGLKTISLGEIFTDFQMQEIKPAVSSAFFGDYQPLRDFLNRRDITHHLAEKNIVPDYLFYFLQHKINQEQNSEA